MSHKSPNLDLDEEDEDEGAVAGDSPGADAHVDVDADAATADADHDALMGVSPLPGDAQGEHCPAVQPQPMDVVSFASLIGLPVSIIPIRRILAGLVIFYKCTVEVMADK